MAAAALALLLVLFAPVPPIGPVIVGVVCGCAFIPIMPLGQRERRGQWLAGLAIGLMTVGLGVSLRFAGPKLDFWDNYYAVIAWLVAAEIALTTFGLQPSRAKSFWKILTVIWVSIGEFIWLGGAYLKNRPGDFYVGIIVLLALLIVSKMWFRLPNVVVLAVNTGILLLVVVPVADWLIRPGAAAVDANPDIAGKDYLYSASRKDPQAYARYAHRYGIQYRRMVKEMYGKDPDGRLPYVPRPHADFPFFQSQIHINGDGFRGPEIVRPKGRTYRIVALGESTTFGLTLTPEHKPWPESFAELVQTQMQPDRPVEVINAGAPGYSLSENLYRMRKSILTLAPDLIISYHGYNGFPLLYPELPPVFTKHLPHYHARPLWLLGECEYRARLLWFRRSLIAKDIAAMPPISALMDTAYARNYEDLVGLAKSNNVRLVVANFSMAVNSSSDVAAREFFRQSGFPNTYLQIKLNEMHTQMIEEICRRHPEVQYVDTHPQLDGVPDKFTDLVHLDPTGDRQLATAFFVGASNLLWREISKESSPSP